jgi:DNA-directed RNA polymerase specialized sigma subunit
MITTTVMTKRKRSEHYVNNKEFLDALVCYRKQVRQAAEKEIPNITEEQLKTWKSPNKPPIPNYIGECILKIATHLSFKPNFVNYMFKDDMISDGIENCIQYLHNFNPEKSTNPFAYFTQIIHYAFLRRIQREKRQLEIKNKILEKTGFDEVFADDSGIDGGNYSDYNSIKENVHIKIRY